MSLKRIQKELNKWTGWPSFLFVISTSLWALLHTVVPSVHCAFNCAQSAKETDYILTKAAETLETHTGMDTRVWWFAPGKRLTVLDEQSTARWYEPLADDSLVSLDPTRVTRLQLVWSEGFGRLFLAYLPANVLDSAGEIDFALVKKNLPHGIPGLTVTFPRSGHAAENLGRIENVFDIFLRANPTVYPALSVEQLMHDTRWRVELHTRTFWRTPRGLALLSISLLMLITSLTGYVETTRETYRATWRHCRRYRIKGIPVSRPSLLKIFLAPSLHRYEKSYVRRANDEASGYGRRAMATLRRLEQEERRQHNAEQERRAFDQQRRELLEQIAELTVLPPTLMSYLEKVEDEELPTTERRDALFAARRLLIEHAKPLVAEPTSPPRESPVRSMKRSAKKGRRYAATIPIASPVSDQSQSIPVNCQGNGSTSYDDLGNWLDLGPLLPPTIDRQHATAIILTGFIKPGQRGRSHWGGRYRNAEMVRLDVLSKLGPRFNPEAYNTVMRWLRRQRIVQEGKKGKRSLLLLSLNPHSRQATSAGGAIINQIQSFQHRVVAELHH